MARRRSRTRDLLRELLGRRPHYAPYLALGDVYFRRREFADAQQSYRRYLSYDPAHQGALTNLGISAINTGQFAEGIRILQRVVDAQPRIASAHRNLAIAFANADRFDQAIVHVEEAARLALRDAATKELLEQLQAARSGRD